MANEDGCGDSAEHSIPQELTSEAKRYAEAHLNETEENRENVVAEIRRWIEDEVRIEIGKDDNDPTY